MNLDAELDRHFWLMVGLVRWRRPQDGNEESRWFYWSNFQAMCNVCGSGCAWRYDDHDGRLKWLINHRDIHIAQLDPVRVMQVEVVLVMQSLDRARPESKFAAQEVVNTFWPEAHPVRYGQVRQGR